MAFQMKVTEHLIFTTVS